MEGYGFRKRFKNDFKYVTEKDFGDQQPGWFVLYQVENISGSL